MNSKTKNIVLLLAIFLVLLLCYQFAISNTLQQKNEYNVLHAEQVLLANAPEKLGVLSKKQIYFDSILNTMNLGNTSIENNLLRVITVEVKKNNLKLLDFNDPHTFEINNSQLNTFDFTLEGNFTSLLNTIYTLEQKHTFGEVVHLYFEKKKNYRSNKNYLTARVFIQNIE